MSTRVQVFPVFLKIRHDFAHSPDRAGQTGCLRHQATAGPSVFPAGTACDLPAPGPEYGQRHVAQTKRDAPARARPTDFWLWAYSAPGAVTTSRRGHSRYSALHTGRLQARQRRVKLIRYGQGDLHWATDNNPIRDAVRTTLPIGSPDIYDSYLKQIIPRWCD